MRDYKKNVLIQYRFVSIIYDFLDLVFFPSEHNNPRYELAKKIPNDDLSVLDVCCGTCVGTTIIARKNNKNSIIGIDISPDMLSIAEKRIKKHNIRNLSVRKTDAENTKFNDNTFDVVTVSLVLHELQHETIINILREIQRVLKNNGRLYILDYRKDEGFLFSLYLKIFEPKHTSVFLEYDWNKILNSIKFGLNRIEHFPYSQLIDATKIS
ncbi:MAG: methyltransferase domain-containing protein [Endomicrobiales bacterium]|nr:methyltransferase domain-containing protein [Endomicrobiales bacterium]